MPRIIDYETVLQRLQAQGLHCLYHNSGAFGFPPGTVVHVLGWIGPDDPTIRPEMRSRIHQVPPPYPENLSDLAKESWIAHLPADAWIMPISHWAYELDHGSRQWMSQALRQISIDPELLQGRNNGSAIEFRPDQTQAFVTFLTHLLQNLTGSDFMIAFPGIDILCTIHHHQQLWWQTPNPELLTHLTQMPRKSYV